MARERLMDLEWSIEDVSFDLLALTSGPAPGDVVWPAPSRDRGELAQQAVRRLLNETGTKVKRRHCTLEELILRRDEDLVGVAVDGPQLLLAGRALSMMGSFTEKAVAAAIGQGLEYWTLSYYDVIGGVIFERRGSQPGRRVAMLGDAASFEATGQPLAFEAPLWDGTTPPADDDDSGDRPVDDNDEPALQEKLAKVGLPTDCPQRDGRRTSCTLH